MAKARTRHVSMRDVKSAVQLSGTITGEIVELGGDGLCPGLQV